MQIRIKPGFFLMLAASVFTLGTEATLALLAGIALHEAGHGAAVFFCGGRVESLSMNMGGLSMRPFFPKLPSYGIEMLCVAAGPAASLLFGLLFAFWARQHEAFYLLAGVNLSLGLFNLIPVSGFDGGRLLSLWLEKLAGPAAAGPYIKAADGFAVLFLLCLGFLLFFRAGRNYALLLSLLYPAGLALSGMIGNKGNKDAHP